MKSLTQQFIVLLIGILVLPASELCAQVGGNNPTGPSGEFNGSVTTGCSYDPYTGNASRTITDISVAGAIGEYGLSYSRIWTSRGGGSWSGSYDWSVEDVLDIPAGVPVPYTVHFPNGGVVTYTLPGPTGPPGVRERFKTGSPCYLILTDGGKIEFQVTQWSYVEWEDGVSHTFWNYTFRLQAIVDPFGQRTTVTYNANGTMDKVKDPTNTRWIQFFYTAGGQIDYIQGSDGRIVDYTYTTAAVLPGTVSYTLLTGVNYYAQNPAVTATYTYQVPNVGGDNGFPLLRTCDDSMYAGPMKRIGYVYKMGNNDDTTPAAYGQILSENYYDGSAGNPPVLGAAVSTLSVNGNTRTETCPGSPTSRTRTFTYSTSGLLTSVTDFKGIAQTQTYDAKKFVNAVTDRRGNTTNFTNNQLTGAPTLVQFPLTAGDTPPGTPRGTNVFTYGWASCPDPNNRDTNNPYYLYSVTDEGGNATTFTRDPSKRVTRIDYPDGGYETFAYSTPLGQVTSHRMKTGGTETWTYNAAGVPQSYRNPSNPTGNETARYQYNSYGRVLGITDVLGSSAGDVNHTTSFTYNARGQLLTATFPTDKASSGQGTTTISKSYNSDGTLASETDQLSHTTWYTYDDYRRLRSVEIPQPRPEDCLLRTTRFYYDSNQGAAADYTHTDANVTLVTLPSGNIIKTHYDENYRKDWEQPSAANGTDDLAKTSVEYDNVGNLRFVTGPNQQPSGPKTEYIYDERNRPWKLRDPLYSQTSSEAVLTYDAAGRTKTVTRQNGQVITYDSYDPMNRLLQQTVKQTPDPDAVTKYTYYTSADGATAPIGLLKTMQDPRLVATGSPHKYTCAYDNMGRKTSLTYPPDSGSVQRTESWHYNTAGHVDTFTNRDGKVETLTYDWLNRQTGFSWNDNLTPSVTFGYDSASRVTSITNRTPPGTLIATVTRTYFNDDLLQSETQTPNGQPGRTVNYTHNADGGRASIQYPDGSYSFTYEYSGRDQMKTIKASPSGTPIATYGCDANSNVISRVMSNGTTSVSVFDALNRVTNISHSLNTTTCSVEYDYDFVGNQKWAKRDTGKGERFGYDLHDQVTSARIDIVDPDAASTGSQTIVYDANGNRTAFAAFDPTDPRAGTTDTYSLSNNGLNQYGSRTSLGVQANAVYDPKGNLTAGVDGSTYQYDAQNRLTNATKGSNTITLKYDGLGRQVSRKLNSNQEIYSAYDGWELIAEYQSGSLTAAFLSGAGGLVKDLVNNRYFYQDGNGSTSHLADNNGYLVEWYRYDLYGKAIVLDPANVVRTGGSIYGVRHLFTGQQWMSELGVYNLRNRYYSPDLGRFLQPDPIGFGGDPSNIYRYVGNNPVNRSDPSGLASSTGPNGKPPVQIKPNEPMGPINLPSGMTMEEYRNLPTAVPVVVIGNPVTFDLANRLGGIGSSPGDPGGGSRGGASGNNKGKNEDHQDDDCYTMAEIVQALSDLTKSDKDFLDALARVFTSADSSSTLEMYRHGGGMPPMNFGDSGFRQQFVDPGSNQVRHFAGAFIAGANGYQGLFDFRERLPNSHGNVPDLALNQAAYTLASAFTGQPNSVSERRALLAKSIKIVVCD